MNLLPDQYVQRSKNRARSSRVAVAIIICLGTVAAIATHSKFALNAAVEQFVVSQSKANSALELEVDASSLELRKSQLEQFINRYEAGKIVFPMGDLIATIANMLPDSMTLEELLLDVVQTENGRGISGHLSGFSSSDEIIAFFVSALQDQNPFGDVSMDFSKSRTIRGIRARGFRISFKIDLERPWDVSQKMSVAGGEE